MFRLGAVLSAIALSGCTTNTSQPVEMPFERAFSEQRSVEIYGSPEYPLFAPRLVIGDAERVYVVDPPQTAVLVYGREGAVHGAIRQTGPGPGELESPIAVTVNPETGTIYVYDEARHIVALYDGTFRFIESWPITTPSVSEIHFRSTMSGDQIILIGLHYKYGEAAGRASLAEIRDATTGRVLFSAETVVANEYLMHKFSAATDDDGNIVVGNQLDPRLIVFGPEGQLLSRTPASSPSFTTFRQSKPFKDFSYPELMREFERLESEEYSTLDRLIKSNNRIVAFSERRHGKNGEDSRYVVDVYKDDGALLTYGSLAPGLLQYEEGSLLYFSIYDDQRLGRLILKGYSLDEAVLDQ